MGDERREYDGSGHDDEPAGGKGGPDDTRAFDPLSGRDPDGTQAFEPPGDRGLDDTQAFDPFSEPDEKTGAAEPSPEPSGDPAFSGDPDATVVSRPSDPDATVIGTRPGPGSDPDATVIRRAPVTPDSTSILPQEGAVWSGRAGVPPPGGPNLRDPAPYRDSRGYDEPMPPQGGQRRWWTPVLLGVVALGLLGVVVLAAWWMSRDRPGPEPSPTEIPTPTLAPATSAPAPTTAAPSPTAALVQVPRLVGVTQDQAASALDALGLSYRFEYRQSAEPQGEVIESRPREGEIVPSNTTVTLVISTGPAPRTTTTTPRPPQPSASAEPGEDGGNGD